MTNSTRFPQQPNAPVRPTIQVFNGSATVIYAYLVINDYTKQVGKVALGNSKAHTHPTRYMQIRGGHREYGKTQEDMIRAFVKAGYNVEDNTWEKAGGVRVTRYHYANNLPKIKKSFVIRNNEPHTDYFITLGRKLFKVGWMTTAVEGRSERRANVLGLYISSALPNACYEQINQYVNKHGWPLSIFS